MRGLVSLTPRVGLHVHVLRPEELLGPLDGDVLDLVDLLAAAVVALAWIAFGVLVRQYRALGGEYRRRGKVLACDQLDGRTLAFQLTVECILHLGINDLGVRSDHVLPPLWVREVPGGTPGEMVVERSCGATIPRVLPTSTATARSIDVRRGALKLRFLDDIEIRYSSALGSGAAEWRG